jgi:hypothetical protein
MSASQQPGHVHAAAFRILSYLDTYEDDLRSLAEEPCSATQASLAAQIATMRAEATLLPQLIVRWIEFLISHERLLQSLAITSSICDRLDDVEKHIGLLLRLQDACLELLTGKQQLSHASYTVTVQRPASVPGHRANAQRGRET